MLDDVLQYQERPEDDEFVARVMRGVQRQQRTRKLILACTGVLGAVFGVAGAFLLSDDIGQLIRQVMTGKDAVYTGFAILVSAGVMAWLLHDETGLST
jgi:hypothetical protein